MEDEILLRISGVGCELRGRPLWRGLSADLPAKSCLGVAGASGSGKTMLLRTLAGLEPLQSGSLAFRGRSIADWPMPEYRSRVTYVAQRPALREGDVEAVLTAPFGLRVHSGKRLPAEKLRIFLEDLHRDERFLRKSTERLSGGECQLVVLFRALLLEPDILLLDEPTASLDAGAAKAIEQLVAQWLGEKSGRACVWISHDGAQLCRVSNSVLTLEPPI